MNSDYESDASDQYSQSQEGNLVSHPNSLKKDQKMKSPAFTIAQTSKRISTLSFILVLLLFGGILSSGIPSTGPLPLITNIMAISTILLQFHLVQKYLQRTNRGSICLPFINYSRTFNFAGRGSIHQRMKIYRRNSPPSNQNRMSRYNIKQNLQ
mmetsp:Transcript_40838/g.52572  ORF Transcript_40838/g.52572 Transcript_40838/m.52572 type:complete len:154 (-) Transcript_40838:270-731(-)